MIKNVKIISCFLITICFGIIIYFNISESYSVSVQNRIIDNVFNIDISDETSNTIEENNDYLGYIYIPKYNLKRLIKEGTSGDILDNGFVGIYKSSASLDGDNLIILAGHNINTVFSKLHYISINDEVYIKTKTVNRKFIVYDKKQVNEYDMSYFNNRKNEMILITCTNIKGERLLVMLKEDV